MLKQANLFPKGFHQEYFPATEEIRPLVQSEDWSAVDKKMKEFTSSEGELFSYLKNFHEFKTIEFIISLRDANNEWEEDGIWHDDGSRVFAFSLSLSIDAHEIEGGRLGVRKKGDSEFIEIKTPDFGGIILFLTGVYGYEHKIHQVTKGRRVIIAGWCS